MTERDLDRAEAILGHHFADRTLLRRALTHASTTDSRLDSNERMEFLGDSVLGLVVAERIYDMFPDLLEGEMTKLKSSAVSRQTCAEMARALELPSLLHLGKGMRTAPEHLPQSLAAAVLEAVIAALYLDAGLDGVRRFLLPLIDPVIERAYECGHQENFKSVLQQHAQQSMHDAPVYRVLDEKGPDHAKCFKVGVELGGRSFPPSWGQSKKRAEQLAALNALRELGLVKADGDGMVRVVGVHNEPDGRKPAR